MALSMSASSKMIRGDLPPSSIVTCFKMTGSRAGDLASRRDRSGQRDLVDLRMVDQRCADISVALNHVEQTGGHAGFDKDFGDLQGAERRHLRRFEDHCIAAGECGGGFPAGNLGRVIPGAYAETHPEGFSNRVGKVAACRGGCIVRCRQRSGHRRTPVRPRRMMRQPPGFPGSACRCRAFPVPTGPDCVRE